jgi:hypothetical protein
LSSGGVVVAEATPARIKVPLLNPHRDGALRGGVGGLVALLARGSGGFASLGFLGAAGEARSTATSVDFVLQLLPRRIGVLSIAGVEFVRSCIGELGRRVFQEWDGGLKMADLTRSPDSVGEERRIRELASAGRIPGRRAPAKMAPPWAGFYFGSASLCGYGASSSPSMVVVGSGSLPVVLFFSFFGFFCLLLVMLLIRFLWMISVCSGACNLVVDG